MRHNLLVYVKCKILEPHRPTTVLASERPISLNIGEFSSSLDAIVYRILSDLCRNINSNKKNPLDILPNVKVQDIDLGLIFRFML